MPMNSIDTYRAQIGTHEQAHWKRSSARSSASQVRTTFGTGCHRGEETPGLWRHNLISLRPVQPGSPQASPRGWKAGAALSLILLVANIKSAQGSGAIHLNSYRARENGRWCEHEPINQVRANPSAVLPSSNLTVGQELRIASSSITRALKTPTTLDIEDRLHLLNQADELTRVATQLCEQQAASVKGADNYIAKCSQALTRATHLGAEPSVVDAQSKALAHAKSYANVCTKPLLYVSHMLAAQANMALASARLTLARVMPKQLPYGVVELVDSLLFAKHKVRIAEQEWFAFIRHNNVGLDASWLDDAEDLLDFLDRVLRFDRNAPYIWDEITPEMAQDIYGELPAMNSPISFVLAAAALRGWRFRVVAAVPDMA